jgi:hypothetical protein
VESAAPSVVIIETDPAVGLVVTTPDSRTHPSTSTRGEATKTTPSSEPAPVESTAVPEGTASEASETLSLSPGDQPELSAVPATRVGARPTMPGSAMADAIASAQRRAAVAEMAGVLQDNPLALVTGPAGPATPARAEQQEGALRYARFEQVLNQWRDEAAAPGGLAGELAVSGAALSGGLSVGYVLWLARSGVLMASVVSALPAWVMLDPLPVLAQLKRERPPGEDGDDDSDAVETLFDGAHGAAVSPPADGSQSTAEPDADRPQSFPTATPVHPTRTPE